MNLTKYDFLKHIDRIAKSLEFEERLSDILGCVPANDFSGWLMDSVIELIEEDLGLSESNALSEWVFTKVYGHSTGEDYIVSSKEEGSDTWTKHVLNTPEEFWDFYIGDTDE